MLLLLLLLCFFCDDGTIKPVLKLESSQARCKMMVLADEQENTKPLPNARNVHVNGGGKVDANQWQFEVVGNVPVDKDVRVISKNAIIVRGKQLHLGVDGQRQILHFEH